MLTTLVKPIWKAILYSGKRNYNELLNVYLKFEVKKNCALCYFVLGGGGGGGFSPFSIAITSLGEEKANLCAFRTFVRFVLVWFCWIPLPLGVWEGLWFVIMVLPGRLSFSSFFFFFFFGIKSALYYSKKQHDPCFKI